VSQSAGSVSATSQEVASTSEQGGRTAHEIANSIGELSQGTERQAHARLSV
jgi:methyl-accepting chemotaxis protein